MYIRSCHCDCSFSHLLYFLYSILVKCWQQKNKFLISFVFVNMSWCAAGAIHRESVHQSIDFSSIYFSFIFYLICMHLNYTMQQLQQKRFFCVVFMRVTDNSCSFSSLPLINCRREIYFYLLRSFWILYALMWRKK